MKIIDVEPLELGEGASVLWAANDGGGLFGVRLCLGDRIVRLVSVAALRAVLDVRRLLSVGRRIAACTDGGFVVWFENQAIARSTALGVGARVGKFRLLLEGAIPASLGPVLVPLEGTPTRSGRCVAGAGRRQGFYVPVLSVAAECHLTGG